MYAAEVLKTIYEICKSHENCSDINQSCPFNKKGLCITSSKSKSAENAEEIVSICEQWRKDHPIKTYADAFFEKFPNAPYWKTGRKTPLARYSDIYGGTYEGQEKDTEMWLRPYPEEEEQE